MLSMIAFTLLTLGFQQQSTCTAGQVTGVDAGRDYTVTLCGGLTVGLRGVEAPLRSIPGGINTGDILGDKNVSPEALKFLGGLLLGKTVTLVYDGYRINDSIGRQYAYVYLADRTLVNAELIRRGYGYADRQAMHPMRNQFFALEETAHRAKVGVWNQ